MAGYSASPIDLTFEDDGPGAISNALYSRFESAPLSSGPLNRPLMRPTLKSNPSFGSPYSVSEKMANMDLQSPQPSQVFQHHPSDMYHAGVIPLNQSQTPPDPYRPPFAANNLLPLPFTNGAYPPLLPQPPQLQQPHLPYLPSDPNINPSTPPMQPSAQPLNSAQNPAEPAPHQVIDLTGGSPSPEPQVRSLPPDLPPKTPVCIGQLQATALVLYPVNYLNLGGEQPLASEKEWAYVRLSYERNPSKVSGQDTIHIRTPTSRGTLGESLGGETFAVVEQKIASSVGPMLGKGLIRLEAKVRKGLNVSSYKCLFYLAR
jgi:SWI/SNF-related matrix-associated actin-dependent regulator of chromatin subfamily A3